MTVTPCATSVSLAKFDAVLVGSAVYGRRSLPEAVQFLAARQDSLQDRMVWCSRAVRAVRSHQAFHTELSRRSDDWRARSVRSTSRSRLAAGGQPARTRSAAARPRRLAGDTATGTPSVRGPGAVSGQLEACHRQLVRPLSSTRYGHVTAQLHAPTTREEPHQLGQGVPMSSRADQGREHTRIQAIAASSSRRLLSRHSYGRIAWQAALACTSCP